MSDETRSGKVRIVVGKFPISGSLRAYRAFVETDARVWAFGPTPNAAAYDCILTAASMGLIDLEVVESKGGAA